MKKEICSALAIVVLSSTIIVPAQAKMSPGNDHVTDIAPQTHCSEAFEKALKTFGIDEKPTLQVKSAENYEVLREHFDRRAAVLTRDLKDQYWSVSGNRALERAEVRDVTDADNVLAWLYYKGKNNNNNYYREIENRKAAEQAVKSDSRYNKAIALRDGMTVGPADNWKKRKAGEESSALSVLKAGTLEKGGVAFANPKSDDEFSRKIGIVINSNGRRVTMLLNPNSCATEKISIVDENDDEKIVLSEALCDSTQEMTRLGHEAARVTPKKVSAADSCTQKGGTFDHGQQSCSCYDGTPITERANDSCFERAEKTAAQKFNDFLKAKGARVAANKVNSAAHLCEEVKPLISRPLPATVREKISNGTGVSI